MTTRSPAFHADLHTIASAAGSQAPPPGSTGSTGPSDAAVIATATAMARVIALDRAPAAV
jgi:hypothetical protein